MGPEYNKTSIFYILAACERLDQAVPEHGYGSTLARSMDLAAADGVNGNPAIDWPRLLAADNFTFIHDVSGIHRHMQRWDGKLGGGFVPRTVKSIAVKTI